MKNHLKRIFKRVISITIILVTLLYCFLSGCSSCQKDKRFKTVQGFSVNFIDVGNGDSIFIRFDDGKNMLIDCGFSSTTYFDNICRVLDAYNTTKINYLVLTHPDVDHVGNVSNLLSKYKIEKAFIPNVYNKSLYKVFNDAYSSLVNAGVEMTYSNIYQSIIGRNYFACFLSPCLDGTSDYYGYFNGLLSPTENDINSLSPIIYLEYKGVRFLFTGDATKEQESVLMFNYKAGLYNLIHDRNINLYDIDVLKVAHHGSADSSGYEFLSILKPKIAVISVGGNNVYGHPSAEVINNLYMVNPSVKILRTDVFGDISLAVDFNGKLSVLS